MIPGFEGGQIRTIKRLPHKRGFKNPWRIEYEVFNVGLLGERFAAGATVDLSALESNKLRSKNLPIKILGDGDLTVALTVTAHKISKSAREKIEAAGGTATELGVKDAQGKRRPIEADDVTIAREGETARVHKKMQPWPSRQRPGSSAANA
jgi:large subunit ribosomal protein L15